ncbi:MAG TPA: lipopolysaccharide heptosyltransferase II [Gemmatimonadales bacterium]|nr:lipopolysaccharide heptosyltransferase II [Gemmatimonadales bacterium]
MTRVLVVQTAFLGDVVLTTGLLNELAERSGPVDLVTTPAAHELVATHPAVHHAWTYDKRGADRGVAGLFRLAGALRRKRYQSAYLPHRSLRTAMLARLAGIPERIGFAGGPGSWSYTRRIERPGSGHEAERILALAEPLPGARARVTLGLTEDDARQADEWLAARNIAPGFIALAPGSIWGTKRWPGYGELAATLDQPVVIVGGPEDRPLAESVAAGRPRVHIAAGELSLPAASALIARAGVLVTNDSAPLHLASAVGTPVVALFGPTIPAFGFGPRGERDRIVEHGSMPCRPCSSHGPMVCPLGHHRCLREIGIERVMEAVRATRDHR